MTGETDREDGHCPACGVAYEPLQEYCLECGERLPRGGGAAAALEAWWRRRFRRYPGDWVWPALLLLLVAAAATAVSAASTSTSTTTIVATRQSTPPTTTRARTTTPAAATTAPRPPTTTGRLPAAPGAPLPPRGLTAWPQGGSGFTDVLESVPLATGRRYAVARARQAKAAGLPKPGVLLSAAYPSLHPGYWVVFSGVYADSDAAVAALRAVHSHGFPDAYVARVTQP
jgi:hypothetical protein